MLAAEAVGIAGGAAEKAVEQGVWQRRRRIRCEDLDELVS
jgi:hypothetical protein